MFIWSSTSHFSEGMVIYRFHFFGEEFFLKLSRVHEEFRFDGGSSGREMLVSFRWDRVG